MDISSSPTLGPLKYSSTQDDYEAYTTFQGLAVVTAHYVSHLDDISTADRFRHGLTFDFDFDHGATNVSNKQPAAVVVEATFAGSGTETLVMTMAGVQTSVINSSTASSGTGTTIRGVQSIVETSSSCTKSGIIYAFSGTATHGGAFTLGNVVGCQVAAQTGSGSSTITSATSYVASYGLSGGTITTYTGFSANAGIAGSIGTWIGFKASGSAATTNIGFYQDDSAAQNRFVGKTKFGADSAPTAQAHFAAHSTTASSAPIKLVTGTAMTTPEDGAIEYHASHLYFTVGSTRYQIDQQGGSAAHTMLDGGTVHSDTATQTVSRGSIIYGNATPKWDELVIGSSGKVLTSDGTDVSWQTPATALPSQTKWNTTATTTSYTSTTTLGDITGLTGFTLVASKTYSIVGAIVASSGSGTPDLNIGFDFSSAPSSVNIGYTSATDQGRITADNTNSGIIDVIAATNTVVQISGTFKAGAGAGTLAARACQNTSNVNTVVVEGGSWIQIAQLD